MHFAFVSKIALLSFSVLLLVACESASVGGVATPAPIVPTAAPPTSTPAPAPTALALDTPAPTEPAPSAVPTEPAPSAVPAEPTVTLAPLEANTIPEDGEFDDELPFNTTANDPAVGGNSGDGIANVTFQFFGPDGKEVFRHTENNTLYCAFGGGDNGQDCDRWRFSEHHNQWPNGKRAQSGAYTLVVTIHGVRGGVARNERHATLKLKAE